MWWSLLLVAGCFHPNPQEGGACGAGMECPSPLICDLGICVRTPGDGSVGEDAPPDVAVDADLSCSCTGSKIVCGTGMETVCTLGCMPLTPGARCIEIDPSNGVGITAASTLSTDITVNGGIATFNTDTGAISGVITRAAGSGVLANIAFELRTTGAQPIGVWTFHRLSVNGGAAIRFTGARSAVFVSGTDLNVGGTIDGSGGCYGGEPSCAGPGGGLGSTAMPATGCGPGGAGSSASAQGGDGGGGGGGGRGAGAVGGLGGSDGIGGAAGAACVAAIAEPLVGGAGGGPGAQGAAPTRCKGGGGGGALQLTALDEISITGTVTMGGSGGEGGPPDPNTGNAAAGCGGGAGGALLIEAPKVTIGASAVLAANAGGGGSGAAASISGNRGASGGLTTTPASGGAQVAGGGGGGAGAAGATAPTAGALSVIGNGGGGGGGIGTIYLRSSPGMLTQSGLTTPAAGTGTIRTQ